MNALYTITEFMATNHRAVMIVGAPVALYAFALWGMYSFAKLILS